MHAFSQWENQQCSVPFNTLADKLSRLQVQAFCTLAPWAEATPRENPSCVSLEGLGISKCSSPGIPSIFYKSSLREGMA